MSLSPIPIRVLHKVCVLPVSLRFLGQNDRLAAYASQMLQSIFPAQTFGSGLLCMSWKCLEGKKNTKNTNTPSTPKNNPPPKKTHNSPQTIKLHPTQDHWKTRSILQFVCYKLWEHNVSSIAVQGLDLGPGSLRFVFCLVQRQELLGPRLWTARMSGVRTNNLA